MARNALQIGSDDGNALSLAPWQVGDPTDPMAVANAQTGVAGVDALGAWLAAQRAKSEARTTPFWNVNNPVGTETTLPQQQMSMPDPSFRPGVFVGGGTVPMSREQLEGMRQGQQEFYDQVSLLAGVGPAAAEGRAVTLASRRPLANPPPSRAPEPVVEQPNFTIYHGSPHLFPPTERNPLGEFDPTKIGTGEGAQAYGVGAGYGAENEGVARGYRDALTGKTGPRPGASDYQPGFTVNGVLPPTGMAGHTAMDTAIDMHGLFNYMDMYANKPSMSQFWKQGDAIHPDFDARPSYVQSINYLKDTIERRIANFRERTGGGQELSGIADRDMAALADYYDKHVKDATPFDLERRKGHMYEVKVNADPERFLHWDKPLSEQHPDVQKVLRDLGVPDKPHVTGSMAYNDIAGQQIASGIRPGDKMAEIVASQKLRDAGIPGIRYLDQGSRGAGEGSHNYVVFDANTMNIIRRYGLAGLMAGGGAAAATQQQQPNALQAP